MFGSEGIIDMTDAFHNAIDAAMSQFPALTD